MELPSTNTGASFSTEFCTSMISQVLVEQLGKESNYVSSPMSLYMMLSLVAAGTKGTTLEKLLSHLGSKSIGELNSLSSQIISLVEQQELSPFQEPKRLRVEDSEVRKEEYCTAPTLSFVNGIWIDQSFGLKPRFEEIARGVYKAEAKEIDFRNKADEAEQKINSWVERETRGLIREVLPPGSVESDTAVILANALYFKGKWNQRFDPSKTETKDFHLLNGQIAQAPFMTGGRRERYNYRSFDGYKVLQLPYQGAGGDDTRRFSMYFFLPDKIDGLSNLVETVTSQPGFFNQQFVLGKEELPHFWIPRFKFSFEFEALQSIRKTGLDILFRPGEVSEMVDSPNREKICLSKVFHKSYIEVNEEGTEAAASTAVRFRKCCGRVVTPSFVADHPFLFMIREEATGTVFFIGALLNPLLVSS